MLVQPEPGRIAASSRPVKLRLTAMHLLACRQSGRGGSSPDVWGDVYAIEGWRSRGRPRISTFWQLAITAPASEGEDQLRSAVWSRTGPVRAPPRHADRADPGQKFRSISAPASLASSVLGRSRNC